ncbi:hypothetical protein S7711_03862 [Stachybotrys chartarum IBT 7711]|jgi:thioesterase domain-containing protein|uniref:Thioesterase domain-containing protein n=1 Tax=Stachybotrys chartarum (strain CBS 109288 / IBT 7711) TaxID=1280523 RepID=A0A084AHU0_STACB|nr:hypothetical protein S7711_03862 [Stachybotrys chartarum IBT 7711]KFA53495.1 hypothetical protein S40293_06524 [Stachybotrys chartarum IBT 40293]
MAEPQTPAIITGQAPELAEPQPPAEREECLELVQMEDWRRPGYFSSSTLPLFLIHDGGGTIFAYHCLDPLGCHVYGIRNPNWRTGDKFAGGIAEMGRLYAGWIRQAVAKPGFPVERRVDGTADILLGGWSLGGMLSLEVAKVLEGDPTVRVRGIIMVDSIYPRNTNQELVIEPWDTSEEGKTMNQILASRSMAEGRRMIQHWEIPRLTEPRPRIVLLRATGYVPPKKEGNGIVFTDVHRGDRNLGWDNYDKELFDEVVDVKGHHFDLFEFARVAETTAVLRKAVVKMTRAALAAW